MTRNGKSTFLVSSTAAANGRDPGKSHFQEPSMGALVCLSAALLASLLGGPRSAFSQSQPPARNFIGTISAFGTSADTLEIKPDNAPPLSVKLSPKTIALKVAPGEKDLKKAEPIPLSDLSVGDRVLVSLETGTTEARRIIVMSATDIAKRNEADRQDWIKRGIFGVVTARDGNQITLRVRSMQGPVPATVTVDEHTGFKRYAPDSVKFIDASPSSVAEIAAGDQLRARGQKSEDGLKVAAEEVVFGTFLTKAGSIVSVNTESKEITAKELGTGKSLVIKITADSQLRKMPDFGGMMPGGGRPGGPAEDGDLAPRGDSATGPPRGPMGAAGRPRDISQMLERMPAIAIGELKQGDTIVVSSTKGAQIDQITAIMLVANADRLIRMASPQSGANHEGGAAGHGMNGGMMGQMEGFGGLEMPGMVP